MCRIADDEALQLVGSAGFKGPPDDSRTVEVGYSLVSDYRRRGYATEATKGLIDFAFAHSTVDRIIAETLPSLDASIGVMNKVGFRFAGQGSEAGVIRFELSRASHNGPVGQ